MIKHEFKKPKKKFQNPPEYGRTFHKPGMVEGYVPAQKGTCRTLLNIVVVSSSNTRMGRPENMEDRHELHKSFGPDVQRATTVVSFTLYLYYYEGRMQTKKYGRLYEIKNGVCKVLYYKMET